MARLTVCIVEGTSCDGLGLVVVEGIGEWAVRIIRVIRRGVRVSSNWVVGGGEGWGTYLFGGGRSGGVDSDDFCVGCVGLGDEVGVRGNYFGDCSRLGGGDQKGEDGGDEEFG